MMARQPTYLPDGREAYDPKETYEDLIARKAAIEAEVREEGFTNEMEIFFEASRRWTKLGLNKESYSDFQKRVLFPRWKANQKPSTALTAEEWAHLADMLEGANHPLSQSIHTKATQKVEESNHEPKP